MSLWHESIAGRQISVRKRYHMIAVLFPHPSEYVTVVVGFIICPASQVEQSVTYILIHFHPRFERTVVWTPSTKYFIHAFSTSERPSEL
jgi:hypothetical protein